MTPPVTMNPNKTKQSKSMNKTSSNLKQNTATRTSIQSLASDVFNSSNEIEESDFTQPTTTKRIRSSETSIDPKKSQPIFVTTIRYSSLTIDDDTTSSSSLHEKLTLKLLK